MNSPETLPSTAPQKTNKKWTRRRFFKNTGKAVLFGSLLTAVRVSGYPDPPEEYTPQVFTATDYAIMAAIVYRVIAPKEEDPDPNEIQAVQTIDHYLASFPSFLIWQIRLLLRLVEHTPLFFHGYLRRFSNLDADSQHHVLKGWENSRFATRRQGFKALKTMAYLSYYRHEKTWEALQYEGPLVPKGYLGGEKDSPYPSLLASANTLPKGTQ